MTGLLVSVRNAEEAAVSLQGGADVIDVKEPLRGALGPADPVVWRAIQAVVGEQAVTSVALGELLHGAVKGLAVQSSGFAFAKIGLAGCGVFRGWISRWEQAVNVIPRGVLPVPVAYADCHAAQSPSISDALALATASSSKLLLIDTFDKSCGTLIDHLSLDELAKLLEDAAERGVQLALAGSLTRDDIESLLELAPAYVGVRGATCNGGRDGTIEFARVKSLAEVVRRRKQNEVLPLLDDGSRGANTALPLMEARPDDMEQRPIGRVS